MDLEKTSGLCRLCLCSSKQFINVLGENCDLGSIVAKTIENLLQFKVQKLGKYPWLVCTACLEELIDFRVFKSRCIDSNATFEKRFFQLHSRKSGRKNDGQVVMDESESTHEGIDSEDEDEVELSKLYQALLESEEQDDLASGGSCKYNKEDNANMTVCQMDSYRWRKSQTENSHDPMEDIDIEEGEIEKIKEEPLDDEEGGSVNFHADEKVDVEETQLHVKNIVNMEAARNMTSTSAWNNCSEEADSMGPQENEAGEERNSSERDVHGQQNGVNIKTELETYGANSTICETESFPNFRIDGPSDSYHGKSEMVAADENGTVVCIGPSIKEENDGVVEGFHCVFCSAILRTEKHLRDHIAEHEGRLWPPGEKQLPFHTIRDVEERTIRCMLPHSGPTNIGAEVDRGLRKSSFSNSSDMFNQSLQPVDQPTNKPYECKMCSRTFAYFRSYKTHTISCSPTFACSRCKKNFRNQRYVAVHMKMNKSERELSCTKCPRTFLHKCELSAHKRSHNKQFVCNDCDCVFDRYYHLKAHILTHGMVKPVECKECKETFIGSHTLRKHKREVHSGGCTN